MKHFAVVATVVVAGTMATGLNARTVAPEGTAAFYSYPSWSAIAESARILVTHLTDAQNEGARFKDGTFRRYLSTGSRPLVRTGRAEIALSVDAPAACRVYALRTNGVRKGEVKTLARDGRLVFTAEIAVTDPTLHYEIVRANE